MSTVRFTDQQKILSDFQTQVVVHCPACNAKAMAVTDQAVHKVRLTCLQCGYNKESSILTKYGSKTMEVIMPAHRYFDATLWYRSPFRNDVFMAYNEAHLAYLKEYIGATLREHRDRTHFTLLEKLPKFYHDARNRESLLKLIAKLEKKD